MRYFFRSTCYLPVLWLLLALTLPHVSAQTGVNLRIDRVDDRNFPEVRLYATVMDGQGRVIRHLDEQQFALTEEGHTIPIQRISDMLFDDVHLRVVLAIDISRSIEDWLDQLKEAAVGFVNSLQPDDEVALVFFGTESRTLQPFTADHGLIVNQINSLTRDQLEDYTALYNGTVESIRLAANQGGGRRAVVLLTDGKNTYPDGATTLTLSDAQRESTDKQVPVYVVGVGSEVSEQDLRLMASNGSYYHVDRPEEIGQAYEQIAQELRHQYEIVFQSEQLPDDQNYNLILTVNVADTGSSAASVSMVAHRPKTPRIDVTLPDSPLRKGEPVQIEAQIFSEATPSTIELWLDDILIVHEALSGSTWNYSWVPESSFEVGDHQFDVVVTDTQGRQGLFSQSVNLENGDALLPLWVWALVVVAVSLIMGFVIFILIRRRGDTFVAGTVTGAPFPPQIDTGTRVRNEPTPAQPMIPPTMLPSGGSTLHYSGESPMTSVKNYHGGIQPTEPVDSHDVPRAMLVVEKGKANLDRLTLKANRIVRIGRREDSDLILHDSRVSATHASVRYQENGFIINDEHSTNGIRVNGKRISSIRMQNDDQVQIGDIVLVFKQVR